MLLTAIVIVLVITACAVGYLYGYADGNYEKHRYFVDGGHRTTSRR